MKELLNQDFLISIVWIKEIQLNLNNLKLIVLCVEDGKDVYYELSLTNIAAVIFRQEDPKEEFDVIETVLEPFNKCHYLDHLHSNTREQLWVLRFHSGLHHLVVGFENAVKRECLSKPNGNH